MGTLALAIGCTTAQRAEVSGIVRDRATGRVIAGARVVGADGSLAETDADGRFHLYVRGHAADVRISAAGHAAEHAEIEGLEAVVALAPIEEDWTSDDPHVVTFGGWLLDGGMLDGSMTSACPETSLSQAHSAIECASCHASEDASSSCATCHGAEAAMIRGTTIDMVAPHSVAPHDGLGGGCLACHGEVARGDASASCARCHGDTATTRTTELGHFFALATSSAADHEVHGTRFEFGVASEVEVSSETVATWARALARDRSRGAHDPRMTQAVAHARE